MPNFTRTPHTMIYRCDIHRLGTHTPADETEEAYDYENHATYEPHLTDVMCFYFYDVRRTTGEREMVDRQALVEYLTILVPLGTDVTNKDRVVEIRDRRGQVLISNDIDIVAAQRDPTQIRLICQERR